jgi:L-asparaginase
MNLKRFVSLCAFIILTASNTTLDSQNHSELPKVLIVATGGTIAGQQDEPGTLGRYEITKTADDIVNSVPTLSRYATVETEQFANIRSPSITPNHWLALAKRINQLFITKRDLAGIVVTHGTDRLEETAFFLHLSIRSEKPVVIVGAQRPATGISADGPLNLLSAVRVAADPKAVDKGVLVVMDERILSARNATKMYPRSGGFDKIEMGMLGVVTTESVDFFYSPVRRHTSTSEFDVTELAALPRVGISYSYAGSNGLADLQAKGVVVAATSLTPSERNFFHGLSEKGIVIAETYPTGSHVAPTHIPTIQDTSQIIAVKHLNPLKARILLMLALTKTTDPSEVQTIFDQY